MTEQELIVNMTKGYSKSSNYYRKVQEQAYMDMLRQHLHCDYYKSIKKEILENNDIIYLAKTVTIYNKHHKRVLFTKYTKVPKYRTYRQQLAITTNTYYKKLQRRLEFFNSYRMIEQDNKEQV